MKHQNQHSMGSYARFFAMIGTSTIVMLGLMYLNSYQYSHHAEYV